MVEYGLSQTEQKVTEKAIRKNEVYAECHKSRLCDDRLGVKILIRHGISTTFTWIPSESQSLLESAKKYNVSLTVNRFGSMINPFFVNSEVTDFVEAQLSDTKKFAVFFWEMINNGVFLPPSQFEAWFLSSALSKKDLEKISKAIDAGMKAVSNM